MSVATHLAVSPAKYDARIRSLIPLYDELIAEAARALDHAARPVKTIVDLGIGTGALARACLERAPGARIWGIDADAAMMATARTRLGRLSRRVTMTTGSVTLTMQGPSGVVWQKTFTASETGRIEVTIQQAGAYDVMAHTDHFEGHYELSWD